ncbi:integrase/recombinase XerD [Aquimarina sp. MAR_2010_214]|uniref:tyrosine-type recombinase/integrase n=1 Tax=Aquimarina sp. MAR_2010_214 TaxID=1250026 RepID=UPI000C711A0E|nr:tyrosine-type recombinase/integrase [Aquimarina sp. MAR_2010_214]PKV49594.1 integrase/recombinase XerD [Aquimarina sp. MAR_2010_214]
MKKLKLENRSYKKILEDFEQWLDILGYNEKAVYYTPIFIQEFFYWLEQRDIQRLEQITIDTVKSYYKYLNERSNQRRDGGLSKAYLNKHQNALRKFREYLKKQGGIAFKIHLRLEKRESAIKDVLTQSEIKQLFEVTSYSSKHRHTRIRDRAILVALYSCGLRRTEATSLDIGDILFDARRVFVRQGKNYKERYVPINTYNLQILEDYIFEARPIYTGSKATEALFINKYGNRLHGQDMGRRLHHLLTLIDNEILREKHITPHCLRHSIATHLLQQGMKIEDIQQFLGHSSLKSTQVYTHLLELL